MRPWLSVCAVIIVAVLAVGGLWWRQARSAPPPPQAEWPVPRLVVLYAPCTVSTRFLEPYDPSVDFTPRLARFAAEGVTFSRHQSEAGQSGIAYASLLTGMASSSHGLLRHPMRLPDDAYLIGEAFRDSGYDTYYWAGQPMASPELNYAQGIAEDHVVWSQRANKNSAHGFVLRGGDPDLRLVLGRLRDDPSYRALVIVTFTVTHALYDRKHLPGFCSRHPQRCGPFRGRTRDAYVDLFNQDVFGWMVDFDGTADRLALDAQEREELAQVGTLLYAATVRFLDTVFGELIDDIEAYGLLDQSLIAFTADHGEVMYRDNTAFNWSHGFALAPEVLAVPLIIRAPGLAPGRLESVTRSIDVVPTLLGLSRARVEHRFDGVDLSPVLHGETPPPALTAFSHSALLPTVGGLDRAELTGVPFAPSQPDEIGVALRRDDLLFKHRATGPGGPMIEEVFDLHRDPEERQNRFAADDPTHQAAMRELQAYRRELIAAYGRLTGTLHIPSEREEEILRNLGYR